jgi:polyisoprenoid-binding protein YceI
MARYDARDAQVLVFTFKEGLLSAVAHDLKLTVKRFSIEVDGTKATGEFEPASLSVVTAMKDGQEAPSALPPFATGEIEKNAHADVLEVKRFPTVRFETTEVTPTAVAGKLTLHGVTKELRGVRKTDAGRDVAEFEFDQRDFGIKPYSAMLGTLKIKPKVVVRVSVPKP